MSLSSGNPRQLDAGLGIAADLPRWIDMDDEGRPIDAVGIAPMKAVEASSHVDFRTKDIVCEAALKHAKKNRAQKPGRRE